MQQNILDTPIEYLKGVGPQRAAVLKKELQIFTYKDLINFYPFKYLDRTKYYNISELLEVVKKLSFGLPLEEKYKDHALEGNWKNHRELHIRPDWLLIYQIKDDILILELSRTGTHSDLFKK